jgi:hypothetical protein
MPQAQTLILRAAIAGEASIYRDIEIEASKSLYRLAETIVSAFDFDFDHAFGFYSGDPFRGRRKHPCYELFADMGEAEPGVRGVKKTKIDEAFPAVGHSLLFLFDYGDEWRFRIKLTGKAGKVAKVRYPRIVASGGEAPEQYPAPDDDADAPIFGINLATGERIAIARTGRKRSQN